MHEEFRKLLEDATGESQHIMAIVLDIRGFTPFCEKEDSLDVATYIKKVYKKIIDNYFSGASFFKPTGDGLLVIIPYDEKSLKEKAKKTINSSLELLHDFRDLCSGDPMIPFDTPTKCGIGIARGSACCIKSGEKILDYSGKVLNLASRLMDVARPSGIVLDSKFGLMLLSTEAQKAFLQDDIYVRGIAEKEPRMIYYTKEFTLISDSYKKPIKEPRWESIDRSFTVNELKAMSGKWLRFSLKYEPSDKSKIFAEITHEYTPLEETKRAFERHKYVDLEKNVLEYKRRGKVHYLRISHSFVVEYLERKEYLKENDVVTIAVAYPTI